QRLGLCGSLRPIDPSLLWVAELDTARLDGGKRLLGSIADLLPFVLGGGEHVKRQRLAPGMSAMAKSNPLLSISAAAEATLKRLLKAE
ncbi:MAG: hypothetical protein JO283_17930, partial [Bradyrhizobium sp.]|nr:hypothetical protein [Bradyrhizobium sp.]